MMERYLPYLPLHAPLSGYRCKKSHGGPLPDILLDVKAQDDTDDREERALLCKFCQQQITSMDKAIQVRNSHQHIFTNPVGNTFKIGCFSTAPGCRQDSPPTLEFTWFAGFSWQVALCANCKVQMGWFYQAADTKQFYGLILNHLIESS